MDEMQDPDADDGIPAWTLGWRLQRALAHGGLSAEEMAAGLGVHRGTVSRWMNDRGAPPRAAYLKQWALACRVRYTWLASKQAREAETRRKLAAGYSSRPTLTTGTFRHAVISRAIARLAA